MIYLYLVVGMRLILWHLWEGFKVGVPHEDSHIAATCRNEVVIVGREFNFCHVGAVSVVLRTLS